MAKKKEKKKGKPSKYPERNIARKMGIPLDQFAKAKRSKYDKTARLEKKAALQAKRANDYRRLKNRFIEQGHLPQPPQPGLAQEGQNVQPEPDMSIGGEAVNGAQAEAPVAMPEAGADESGGGEPKKLTPAEKQAAEKERQAVKRAKNKAKKDRKEARKAAEAAANPPPEGEAAEPPKKKAKPLRGPAAKPLAHQLKMAAKLAKRKVRKAAKKITREERKVQRKAKKEREAEKERLRKIEKKKMKKLTKSGQPVMSHRVDKILGQLQAAQA